MFLVKKLLASLTSPLMGTRKEVTARQEAKIGADKSASTLRLFSNLSRQVVASLYLLAISLPLFDASAEVRRIAVSKRNSQQLAELVNKLTGQATAQLALVNTATKSLICLASDESCLQRLLVVGLQKQEKLVVIPNVAVKKTLGKRLNAATKKSRLLKSYKSETLSGASLTTTNIANINDLIRALAASGITLTPLETVLLSIIVQALSNTPPAVGTVAPMVDKIRGLDPELAPSRRVTDVAYSGKWVVLDGKFAKSGNEIISTGTVNGELLFQNESQLLIKLSAGTGIARFAVKNTAGVSEPLSINVIAQPIVAPTASPTAAPTVVPGAPVIAAIQGYNPALTTADRLTASAVSGGQVLLTGNFTSTGNELLSTGNVAGIVQSQSSSQIVVQLATGTGTATFAVKNSLGISQARSIPVLAAGTSTGPKITKIQGFDSTLPVGRQFSDTATIGKQVVLTGNFAASKNELISTGTVGGIIISESTTQINIQLATGAGQAVFAIKNSTGTSAAAQIAVTAGGTSTAAPAITNIQGYDVKQTVDKRRTATAVAGGVVVLTGSFAAKGNQLVSTGNVPATSIILESATELYVVLANVGGTATIAVKNSGGTSAPRSITVTGGTTGTKAPAIQSINGYMQTTNGEMQTSQMAYSGGFVLLSGSFLPSGNTLLSTGLVSGTLYVETATQIVVRLSPGAGKAQFAIRNSQGTSAPSFITVVFADSQTNPIPAPTGNPISTVTPISTVNPIATVAPVTTPVATVTPASTTTPVTSQAPVIEEIVGLDVFGDVNSTNTTRAKAGTYVVIAGKFPATGNNIRSLGSPAGESVVGSDVGIIIIKLAPGTGTASFQLNNANGSSNIVSIPVQ